MIGLCSQVEKWAGLQERPHFLLSLSDLTPSLEMLGKGLKLQEQETLKAVDSAVPTSLGSPTFRSSSS